MLTLMIDSTLLYEYVSTLKTNLQEKRNKLWFLFVLTTYQPLMWITTLMCCCIMYIKKMHLPKCRLAEKRFSSEKSLNKLSKK